MESKKHRKYDLERKRPLFFGIGLIVALGLVISAFEVRTEIDPIPVWDPIEEEYWPDEIIISTEHKKPEPPKPKVARKPVVPVEATEDVQKELEQEFEIDLEPFDDESIDEYDPGMFAEEEVDEPFLFVEKMPEFPGGDAELLSFIAKNTTYPGKAQRLRVSGRVTIDFVVEKDGSVSQVRLKKGIGAGCDEEAMRVVGMLPKFSPGKQRGVPVRVHMSVPIVFKLD